MNTKEIKVDQREGKGDQTGIKRDQRKTKEIEGDQRRSNGDKRGSKEIKR